ncbi:hypothetical protein [Burkholderia ubonensis]|uniref:hypothetical protein n=1 Tax=Burkholderia ubonensis TaxID=101571 RepID=UPI0012FB704C|nr:hypothetical protein [Burkholderia ubonensis]
MTLLYDVGQQKSATNGAGVSLTKTLPECDNSFAGRHWRKIWQGRFNVLGRQISINEEAEPVRLVHRKRGDAASRAMLPSSNDVMT